MSSGSWAIFTTHLHPVFACFWNFTRPTLQVKVFSWSSFGNQGAMATKMVPTWRVDWSTKFKLRKWKKNWPNYASQWLIPYLHWTELKWLITSTSCNTIEFCWFTLIVSLKAGSALEVSVTVKSISGEYISSANSARACRPITVSLKKKKIYDGYFN